MQQLEQKKLKLKQIKSAVLKKDGIKETEISIIEKAHDKDMELIDMNEKSNYFFGLKKSSNVSGKASHEDSDFDTGSIVNDFDEKMD